MTNMQSAIMEAVRELTISQPNSGRHEYGKIITEAFKARPTLNDPKSISARVRVVQIIIKDIINKKNVNYTEIEKSRGDITKLYFYKNIVEFIDHYNTLAAEDRGLGTLKEFDILINHFNTMISLRKDFELGFKVESPVIKATYNANVLAILELINICISKYIFMRASDITGSLGNNIKRMSENKAKRIVNDIEKFDTIVNNGDWSKFMNAYKKSIHGKIVTNGQNESEIGFTQEATLALSSLPPGAIITIVIVAPMILFLVIRSMIYYFYNNSQRLSDYLKTQAEFLEVSLVNSNSPGYKSRKVMYDSMIGIHQFIEAKILKTELATEKDLEKSNATKLSATELNKDPEDSDIVF